MIYLCIPAHNEEQTVGVVLWKIRQVLTEFPRDYQLLVADDASTDSTADVLAPYARVLPLTVLRARERRGYAASLEMLVREACRRSTYPKRDVIVTLQADFTDEPEDIVPLIKKIEQGADIVGGSRATDTRPPLLERWLLAWQRRVLGRVQWPDECGDPLTGFRAYRVHTLKRALDDAEEARLLSWEGPIADAELLRAAAPHARRVEFIELAHRPDRRQRPTRASTWETFKKLRQYVRGTAPIATVPLAELSPETVPAPRPLDIARERRSEALAEAAAAPRRNGRTSRGGTRSTGRAAEGTGGSGGARRPAASRTEGEPRGERPASASGGRTRPERAAGGRSDRPARERPAGERPARERPVRDRPAGERPERHAEGPRRQRPSSKAAGAVAPEAELSGMESTAPAESETPPPRKKRRRRRRKPSRSGAGPTSAAGESPNGVESGGQQDASGAPSRQTRSAEGAGAADAQRSDQAVGADSSPSQAMPASNGEAVSGEAETGEGGKPRQRRRRGGRRGGRGRRRPGTAGAEESAGPEAIGAEGAGAEPGRGALRGEGAEQGRGEGAEGAGAGGGRARGESPREGRAGGGRDGAVEGRADAGTDVGGAQDAPPPAGRTRVGATDRNEDD